MSPHSIHAPLNDLIASVLTAGTSLVQAVVALFHLILAFGHFGVDKFVQLAQTCIHLGFDLFRGVAGFVVANFFVLLILGGGYYWWTARSRRGKERRGVKLRK
ncbi:hypothetical protein DFH94DRAFT_736971 [Russula ochroleuca]|uniref:Uncharacterized protein n=1 Tax=Russula ochroleuca TaxID=152965 RepID=A0A9P5TA38_9AGAM|nr:hypothetical protein DFH94DRAFT_736971 [Russula ochroleuca]